MVFPFFLPSVKSLIVNNTSIARSLVCVSSTFLLMVVENFLTGGENKNPVKLPDLEKSKFGKSGKLYHITPIACQVVRFLFYFMFGFCSVHRKMFLSTIKTYL